MSNNIYLVQVLPYLRFQYEKSTERTSLPHASIAAFYSFRDAQEWAAGNVPTFLNPLTFAEDGGSWPLYPQTSDTGSEYRTIPQQEMREFVASLGLVPPPLETFQNSTDSDEPWNDWWEATAPQMSKEQKTAIWRFLVPHPYRVVEVEIEP